MILSPTPNTPSSFKVVEEPNLALYISTTETDREYSFVLIDGERWAVANKQIKHYRSKNATKVN